MSSQNKNMKINNSNDLCALIYNRMYYNMGMVQRNVNRGKRQTGVRRN